MTTIAYRDGVFAGDTQATNGYVTYATVIKVSRGPQGVLAGASGGAAFCQQFIDWVEGGEKGEAPKPNSDDDGTDRGLIVRGTDTYEVHESTGTMRLKAPYFAIGSGRDIALGAMHAGATAADAVRAAITHDVYTGGDVVVRYAGSDDAL